ncbi:protein-L-isoaspartate(D-aspartate) O-methyltransferase [Methylibium sp.]|uniref:protein-L-isoaspartate(D-aspartate) O-methyltransferase n=1 Tax=Methylibium sp. TaxID=2067992 RepID=UPI003D0A8D85
MSAGPRAAPKFPLRLDQVKPAARAEATPLLRPQRPLQQAAVEQRGRAATPAGLGLDSHHVRERMLARLQAEGVRDARVLAAMRAVPRHAFVDTALANQAYEDTSLPIGLGQTISKPSVVARMVELMLAAQPVGARPSLLEIGSGCGYQAAVLAQLARQVISIERLRPLYDKARSNLAALHVTNLRLVYGDGRIGHAPNAPYDGIIAAAGGEDIPAPWLDQLAPGGRLVAPMLDARSGGQVLVVIDRHADGSLQRSLHEAVRFVPLKSGID